MTVGMEQDADRLAQMVASLVLAQLDGGRQDCWWSPQQVAAYSGHGRPFVAEAQSSGAMHSHQRGDRGRRFTKRSVVDAWMQGATPEQQAQVCGCPRFSRWAS